MHPLGDLSECVNEPYTEDFLCATVCLLWAISVAFGPSWMQNISLNCEYEPVQTQGSRFLPVHSDLLFHFPLCLCSQHGAYLMGNLTARCISSLPADSLSVTMCSMCNLTTDYSCITSSVTRIFLPNLGEGTLPLADIFWYCGCDWVRQTLLPEWQGCCAPVQLYGKTRVLLIPEDSPKAPSHRKCDTTLGSVYS